VPNVDLLRLDLIERALLTFSPDIVINPAAYTAIRLLIAQNVNPRLPSRWSENRRERRCEAWRPDTTSIDGPRLRQQKKQSPYIETDTVGPETVYGRSKLEGEHAVAAANQRHIIPRTAWVYSPFGNNIARTMHRRLHLTTLPKRSTAPMVACQSWSRIAQTIMGPINFPKSLFR
jgi:dTDP-4-dehydrorhamnose reductase